MYLCIRVNTPADRRRPAKMAAAQVVVFALAMVGPSPGSPLAVLEARGLSRREVASIDARHRRRHGKPLSVELVDETLRALDSLGDLLPQQVVHLLRSNRLDALAAECARVADRPRHWCSFKKTLCDCAALPLPDIEPEPTPPRLLAIDCEFRPLRIAAVDERLQLRFDYIVPDEHSFPMMPGVLSCDHRLIPRSSPAETRQLLLRQVEGGARIVGHTVRHDLEALGFAPGEITDGRVADVARTVSGETQALAAPPSSGEEGRQKGGGKAARRVRKRSMGGEQLVSLRTMAREQLGVEIHGGGGRHCAIQDAEVAMRLYLLDEQNQ